MKKRIADIVVETLIENGITDAFSVVGGGAMHLNNAFALKKEQINTVYNHHEQACAMAAESYAKLTGKTAAVCVTSGPGGLNTLNGVQGAWVDSIPMIVIAGHPRLDTTVEASGLDVRCIGVQENDIVSQVKNITKYAKLVKNPCDVKREVQRAIDMALEGRRGPSWLSIPLDVQGAMIEESQLLAAKEPEKKACVTTDEVQEVYTRLKQAKRPCILTGSGIRAGAAEDNYRAFLKQVKIPIVGGAFATDANYTGEDNYYGMSGSIGPRCGNFILQNADFILVLGNSLSSSQTGFEGKEFAPGADIYMVDAQPDEAKKQGLHVTKCICTDLNTFFEKYIAVCENEVAASAEWFDYCNYLNKELPHYEVLKQLDGQGEIRVHPTQFWKAFLPQIEEDAVIALGNSSCIHGILQEGVLTPKQRVLVNYHSGSMGIDLPYAIGAATASDAQVYCVTGDGCVMMNLQELQTIAYHKYNIKLIIFSNQGYDNIRNTCNNYFNGLGNGCDAASGISMPDFQKVAAAFDLEFHRVKCVAELEDGLKWLKEQTGPCILEIYEKLNKERAPIVKSILNEEGKFVTPALHIMSPLLDSEVMQGYLKYYEQK